MPFIVSIFGTATDDAYDDLTRRLCAIAQQYLQVPPARTYVRYREVDHWGYNNFNF